MRVKGSAPRRRKSIRLRGFDYTQAGAYFVTVCTHHSIGLYGDVIDGVVKLTPLGEIVGRTWFRLPDHYPSVGLDDFAVMPNHVHAVIIIHRDVGAGFKSAPTQHHGPAREDAAAGPSVSTRIHSLSEIVRAFKTFSARRINFARGTRGEPVWQRGFHEHVVRDARDLGRTRQHIGRNPACWIDDEGNPAIG